ncbi:hypothetical protein NB640_11510 [Oxalobacter vibrioformis]|uniref:Surface-adhesin protein E-like domain-containing protein n=1 Tax=Oxalobacter vibrioformis TaxID=933080 RepID=A0A9E9LYI1_9BURK|nr:surface-adhesin E family protein [Oxalobacter vibrioformis]WAW09832.1 hypothetical protein NB640_11510 [Oxalobacter vibrioformis]
MKKILAIAIGVFCVNAWAAGPASDWTHVKTITGGNIYLNKKTMEQEGAYKKAWVMIEMTEPMVVNHKDNLVKSFMVLRAYDCEGKKEKFISQAGYAGSMGTGKEMLSDTATKDEWKAIVPGSSQEAIIKAVCAAK